MPYLEVETADTKSLYRKFAKNGACEYDAFLLNWNGASRQCASRSEAFKTRLFKGEKHGWKVGALALLAFSGMAFAG
jgi:hypothetical protein